MTPARLHARAALRIRWAHLDPRPLTPARIRGRLLDVVTAHDLTRWRVGTGADPDGHAWASVSWVGPRGEVTVREPWSRHAARRLSAKVGRVLHLEATGRLRPARPTPAIRGGDA